MQDSIYHKTLKLHLLAIFAPKCKDLALRKLNIFMDVNT